MESDIYGIAAINAGRDFSYKRRKRNPKRNKSMKKRANILIVDDDPNILSSFSDILKDAGYSVATANNGTKAIEKVGKQKFNAVLLDISLPDIDGIKVLRSIKKIDPDVSVIIITAHAGLGTSIRALEEGAYDYLLKPFKIAYIKSVVDRAVEKQQLLEKNRLLVQRLTESNKKLSASLKGLRKAQKDLLQTEKISTISQMLVTLHHEINNPLTIIINTAEYLLSMPNVKKDKEFKDNVKIIIRHIGRVSNLIKKGREISRPVVVDYVKGTKMIDLKKGSRREKWKRKRIS